MASPPKAARPTVGLRAYLHTAYAAANTVVANVPSGVTSGRWASRLGLKHVSTSATIAGRGP